MTGIDGSWRRVVAASAAPAAVLALHQVLGRLRVRHEYDHLIHFSGGFAIALWLYFVIEAMAPALGKLTRFGRFAFAFASSLAVALVWEYGEFLGDSLRGTHVQKSVAETMLDLIYGTLGTGMALSLIVVAQWVRRRRIDV